MPGRAGLVVLALAVGACSDNVSTNVITGTSVLTYHDPQVDFGTYRTYAMTSKLAFYSEVAGIPTYTFVPAPAILAAIDANMSARGFLKVAVIDPETPPPVPPDADLALNPTVLEGSRYALYPCDWWVWWSYPSGGCTSRWTYVPYTAGTLLLPLADLWSPTSLGSGRSFEIVWAGVAYAIMPEGSGVGSVAVVEAVNQAFEQSPYLQAGSAP